MTLDINDARERLKSSASSLGDDRRALMRELRQIEAMPLDEDYEVRAKRVALDDFSEKLEFLIDDARLTAEMNAVGTPAKGRRKVHLS